MGWTRSSQQRSACCLVSASWTLSEVKKEEKRLCFGAAQPDGEVAVPVDEQVAGRVEGEDFLVDGIAAFA